MCERRTSFKAFDELGIPESSESGQSLSDQEGFRHLADDLSGLHAKAYFCDYDHYTYALLGSANATEAGFTKNVEFLLEMRGAKKRLGVQRIMESLKDVPFADVRRHRRRKPALTRTRPPSAWRTSLRDAAAQRFLLDASAGDA